MAAITPAGSLRGVTAPDAVEAGAGAQGESVGADVGAFLRGLGTAMAAATPAQSDAERWATSTERARLLRNADSLHDGSGSEGCKQN